MLPEARGCLLTQRRHLAPCRKRDAFPARQRYKIFYSIQIFFLHGEGVGGLRPVGWVFGLRPMDGVACGQKSEKIYFENPREYFRIVSAVSALFPQYNRFLDCEKMRKGRNWAKIGSLREGGGEGWAYPNLQPRLSAKARKTRPTSHLSSPSFVVPPYKANES